MSVVPCQLSVATSNKQQATSNNSDAMQWANNGQRTANLTYIPLTT